MIKILKNQNYFTIMSSKLTNENIVFEIVKKTSRFKYVSFLR